MRFINLIIIIYWMKNKNRRYTYLPTGFFFLFFWRVPIKTWLHLRYRNEERNCHRSIAGFGFVSKNQFLLKTVEFPRISLIWIPLFLFSDSRYTGIGFAFLIPGLFTLACILTFQYSRALLVNSFFVLIHPPPHNTFLWDAIQSFLPKDVNKII